MIHWLRDRSTRYPLAWIPVGYEAGFIRDWVAFPLCRYWCRAIHAAHVLSSPRKRRQQWLDHTQSCMVQHAAGDSVTLARKSPMRFHFRFSIFLRAACQFLQLFATDADDHAHCSNRHCLNRHCSDQHHRRPAQAIACGSNSVARSASSSARHSPVGRSPSASPPTDTRCSVSTWLPSAANILRTW